MGRETQAREPTTKPILPLPSRRPPLRRALYASQETAGEVPGIAAQMERAERFGHRFLPDEPGLAKDEEDPVAAGSPGAGASAPIQRVNEKGKGKKKGKGKATKKLSKSPKDRLLRWSKRGSARRERGRFARGRYQTSTGPITIGGLFGQRMTQARKGDYNEETYGSIPPYASLKKDLPGWAMAAIYKQLPKAQLKKLTTRQKLAASLSTGVSNISEEDRAPGIAKLTRALARQRVADPTKPHPFDASVNPAVSTAEEARDLVSGKTKLNKSQKSAIEDYASDSSDEEADETTGTALLQEMEED